MMPLERYRDVTEIPPAPAPRVPTGRRATDAELLARIGALWAFAAAVTEPLYRPGVQRFGAIEAANAAQEAALVARIRRMGARTANGGTRDPHGEDPAG